ncbi:MAG: para-aminobenzoate synthase, (PABA) [Sclerophora amabilis]|nr:MAG: para-aminobenzoate synthase, (PABA) [Sclerophora amabilis]
MNGRSVDRQPSAQEQKDKKRILFVDAFDSFASNIVNLLETTLDVEVQVIKIDAAFLHGSLVDYLKQFSAVILGPGPGSPNRWEDVGIMRNILHLEDQDLLPVLGICLGFQVLAHEFGASINELRIPCHGIVAEILNDGASIFNGVQRLQATRYHSLEADMGHVTSRSRSLVDAGFYSATKQCPTLLPLAWTDDAENGDVLMAVKHTQKPFWGLQYHPESICSNEESTKVIRNWWIRAQQWRLEHSCFHGDVGQTENSSQAYVHTLNAGWQRSSADFHREDLRQLGTHAKRHQHVNHLRIRFDTSPRDQGFPTLDICEWLKLESEQVVLLDSQNLQDETGQFSIIGLTIPQQTIRVEYYAAQRRLLHIIPDTDSNDVKSEIILKRNEDVWQHLSAFLAQRKAIDGDTRSPFWGGLMGYVSYEAGLGTVNVSPSSGGQECAGNDRPDVIFAFVERSIVFDHKEQVCYVQSLLEDDFDWIRKTGDSIRRCVLDRPILDQTHSAHLAMEGGRGPAKSRLKDYLSRATVDMPDKQSYIDKVLDCQSEIRRGYSYELCLTDQTLIAIPRLQGEVHQWSLYRELCEKNSAPFAAYLRLHQTTILSSSPERFLHWDRQGKCQLRPIKGTVKKTPSINTASTAAQYLLQPKEVAENLMIVDLTRHDLYTILGSGRVSVPKLMSVEEYATVFQLTSVIEGDLPGQQRSTAHRNMSDDDQTGGAAGIDVLASCLPPGSMTGAPKKASCQILQRIEEGKPRGVYSGVMGYMCAGGGGSFSVVIRTAFKWDDEGSATSPECNDGDDTSSTVNGNLPTPHGDLGRSSAESMSQTSTSTIEKDIWHIGAGGAITALSDPESEWEEMKTKLASVLKVFDASVE